MKKNHFFALLPLLATVMIVLTACPRSVDERIRESTRVPGLTESVQARDRALQSVVEENILSDLELRWYAQTYGITVEVSHTVATVSMKLKTEDQRDRALELARGTDRVSDVIDNIEVDPGLDSAPFDWS